MPPPRRPRGRGVLTYVALGLFCLVGLGVMAAGAAAFFFLDLFVPASPMASATNPPTTSRTEKVKDTTRKEDTKADTKATTKLPATTPVPSPPPVTPVPTETLDDKVRDRVKSATVALSWVIPGDDKETIRTGFLAVEPDLILTSAQGIRVEFGAVRPPEVDVTIHPGEPDAMMVSAQVIGKTADEGLYLLRVQRREDALKLPLPLSLQPVPVVQPKQTVFALSSSAKPRTEPTTVSTLVVSAIAPGTAEAAAQVRLQGSLPEEGRGAPVINSKGNIVGVGVHTAKGPAALGGESLGMLIEAVLQKSSPAGARPRGIGATRIFEGHQGAVFSVALSQDGKLAASGGADKAIRVWDVATGQTVKTLKGHTDEVHAVALSRDGKVLVSGSFDKTIRLWDVTAGKQVGQLKPEMVGKATLMGQVYALALSPDGQLAVSGDDQSARIWDLANGVQLQAAAEGQTAVAFAPDGKLALLAGQKGLASWKPDGKSDPRPIKTGNQGWVNGVAMTRDGKRLLSCQVLGEVSRIALWNLADGKPIREFEGEASGEFFGVALSPDDTRAVSGDEKGFVRVWDVEKGKETFRGVGHGGPVKSVVVSADGKFLLSGSEDGTLRSWPLP